MKIHHVAISVKDLETSIAWYGKFFGFIETHRVKREDKEIALLNLSDFNLEIFQVQNNLSAPEYEGNLSEDLRHVGVRHFAIHVDNLKEKIDLLRMHNVEFVSEPAEAFYGGVYCFVKDPDGILVELVAKYVNLPR